MTRAFKVVFYVLLLAALAGGVILVRQTQETRRGAASNDVGMSIQPSAGDYKKGDQIEISLFINTGADSNSNVMMAFTGKLKYDSTKLKYVDKSIIPSSEMILANDGLPFDVGETNPSTGEKLCIQNKDTGLYNCGNVCQCAFGVDKNGPGTIILAMYRNSGIVASPAIKVVSMKFEVLADSGEAKVEFDNGNTVAVGSNAETDWDVTTKTGASYTIGGVTETAFLSPTAGATETVPPECTSGARQCVSASVKKECINGAWVETTCATGTTCNAVTKLCVVTEPGVTETIAPECTSGEKKCVSTTKKAVCTDGSWVETNCGADETCNETSKTCETTIVDTGTGPTFNFKVSFMGVKKANLCADHMTANLVVKAVGESKLYSGIAFTRTADVGSSGFSIYTGTKVLSGFNSTTGVAAFFKGMKHLQMKYSKDGQVGSYGKDGGELDLTDSAKVYDFSEYPMLVGDVDRNGEVNADDFSLMKTKIQTHETVAESDANAIYDLDGNCQLNTMDIGWLANSLNAKQGELY